MIAFSTEVVKSKGLEKISVEELVSEITPRGRGMYTIFTFGILIKTISIATVPDAIKAEMLNRIRRFLQTN